MRLIDIEPFEKEGWLLQKYVPGEYGLAIKFKDTSEITNVDGWISVKDRLPDMDGSYIVYGMSDAMKEIFPDLVPIWICNWYQKYGGWYSVERQKGFDYITHWMPLPEPPKEG